MWKPASIGSGNWSQSSTFLIHLICGVGLAVGFWVAHNLYSFNLLSNPSHTLRLLWLIETPIVILLYSCFRLNPDKCSYLKAVLRGLLGLPTGALINALGAIALGAPVGIQYTNALFFRNISFRFSQNDRVKTLHDGQSKMRYIPKTINWSLLMSLFTFVPAASVFGSSWADWQHIYAYTKPNRPLEYMICIPAHGAVIGAWFGAWPMPLDWERPWQEWPICVSYGAIIGYLVGMVASWGLAIVHGRQQHYKGD